MESNSTRILVTAFDPFGGEFINPSQEAMNLLPDRVGTASILKLTLPTAFDQSLRAVCDAIRQHQPDAILMLGQAGGRDGLSVERVGINLDDTEIPDNQGAKPCDLPVVKDGPAAYFCTLPVKKIVSAIREASLPAHVSNSAGTFVCNHLLYGVLHFISQHDLPVMAGFIHLPYLPEQAGRKGVPAPSMSLEEQVRGLVAALRAAAG